MMFIVGGYVDDRATKTVMQYSVQENTWRRLADMQQRRDEFSVVTHGGCVYAVGGWDSGKR